MRVAGPYVRRLRRSTLARDVEPRVRRSRLVPGGILVASRDGERRRDWSHELARDGQQVVRCATRDCPLLRGERCGILAGASAAIYDEETVGPELFLALVRTPARPTVLFARDAVSDGQHHARFTKVLERTAARGAPHL